MREVEQDGQGHAILEDLIVSELRINHTPLRTDLHLQPPHLHIHIPTGMNKLILLDNTREQIRHQHHFTLAMAHLAGEVAEGVVGGGEGEGGEELGGVVDDEGDGLGVVADVDLGQVGEVGGRGGEVPEEGGFGQGGGLLGLDCGH